MPWNSSTSSKKKERKEKKTRHAAPLQHPIETHFKVEARAHPHICWPKVLSRCSRRTSPFFIRSVGAVHAWLPRLASVSCKQEPNKQKKNNRGGKKNKRTSSRCDQMFKDHATIAAQRAPPGFQRVKRSRCNLYKELLHVTGRSVSSLFPLPACPHEVAY